MMTGTEPVMRPETGSKGPTGAGRVLWLVGFMGSGKTAAARELAARTGWPVTETDTELARRLGRSIREIFAREGEAFFRDAESALIRELAEEGTAARIVSCGGGAVLRPENRAAMRTAGTVVRLTVSPEEVLRRVGPDDRRPLLDGKRSAAQIAAMMEERRAAYEDAADLTVSTDGKSPREVAGEILRAIS